jgi:hypothetical protein
MRPRICLLVGSTLALVCTLGGGAQGAVTIGTNLTGPADEINPGCSVACTIVNTAVPSDTAAGGLTSPVNGTVTSWRFKSITLGGSIALRILRPLSGNSFTGAGTSASVASNGTTSAQGPFATSLPIKLGDHVGLNASAMQTALIDTPATQLYWNAPTLGDGQTAEGTAGTREVAVQAVVEPTNTVTFGAPTRNKKKGTATVTMAVPNPGTLSYGGFCVKVAGPSSVTTAGDFPLTVRACGKQKKTLKKKGKVRVAFNVGFTPISGQFGATNESVTLRKKLKK